MRASALPPSRIAEVTLVLTYTAQATHDLVPSDAIEPLVLAIANNFVTERSSPESVAVGCGGRAAGYM